VGFVPWLDLDVSKKVLCNDLRRGGQV
jgi:hypothetical protein